MNENSEIKKLLHKFILNECTAEETEKVIDYCKKNELTTDFPTVEEVRSLLNDLPQMDNSTADQIFSIILVQSQEIEETQERKFPFE